MHTRVLRKCTFVLALTVKIFQQWMVLIYIIKQKVRSDGERQVCSPNTVSEFLVSCSVQDFNILILLFEYVLLIQCDPTGSCRDFQFIHTQKEYILSIILLSQFPHFSITLNRWKGTLLGWPRISVHTDKYTDYSVFSCWSAKLQHN